MRAMRRRNKAISEKLPDAYYPNLNSEQQLPLPNNTAELSKLLIWSAISYAYWAERNTPADLRRESRMACFLRTKMNLRRIGSKLGRLLDMRKEQYIRFN